MTKYTAGIGSVVGNAFLVRYAVFGCLNHILRGSYKTNHREQYEGDAKISAIFIIPIQHVTKVCTNTIGNIAGTAAATAAILHVFNNLHARHNRINYLNYSLRDISLTANRYGMSTEIVRAFAGLENADVAFASVQHYVFFKNSNSLKFLCTAVDASLQCQLDIKANGNCIKATVKLYRINVNIGPSDLCALHSHIRSVFDNLLTVIIQVDPYVLKAITIPARIQNSVDFNANGFLGVAGIACKSVFRHSNTSVV
jgi:hypothetical protein